MTARIPTLYESGEPPGRPPHVSERSRGVALALAVVGGPFGLHRFYTGRTQSAVCMCLTLGGFGLWYLYDVIVIAAGDFHDSEGLRLTRWEVSDSTGAGGSAGRRVEGLEDRMQVLESQVNELAERLDFAERLLAQARERGSLPKG
jgi:hypothetical protein